MWKFLNKFLKQRSKIWNWTMQICNVEDVEINGKWVKSWVTHDSGDRVQFHTRSSVLYRALEARCKAGGYVQRNHPTYIGCENVFQDYQHFTEWCQMQYGYMNTQANGKFWSLDKDIYGLGNKSYSPDTCIFIPQYANCLFTNQTHKQFDLPIGVIYKVRTEVMIKERSKPYEARCSDGKGKQLSVGFFSDPLEAHFAYLEKKLEVVSMVAGRDELKAHSKFQELINKRMAQIELNLNSKIEMKDI